jgi:citrate synthase
MPEEKLLVKDTRTSLEYEIPITRNAVSATDFCKIKGRATAANRADKVSSGLRIYDPGLQNTAVVETSTTFAYDDIQPYHMRKIINVFHMH